MSSAVAYHCRKRRRDDAHGGASPTHRRRRLAPSPFPAVRSFGLRVALASAPHSPCKHTSSARLCRCPISRLLSTTPFSPRVALAPSPRRRRKLRVHDTPNPVSTPPRRRSPFSRVRRFPGLRPFALRFLLATGASAPRRRRDPGALSMGNLISQLLGNATSDGGLELHRERLEESPEVVDLTLEPGLEQGMVDVVMKGIGDWSIPALESPSPTENREALDWTKRRDGRLHESGFEDLSEPFTPLTDKDEREVNALLFDSGHSNEIIVTHGPSNIEITKEKLECLRPRGWLNDEVINLYIELLKERAKRVPERFLKCHFFNTFFYKKLTCGIAGYDYQSVRRWTTFKKLGYGLIDCEKARYITDELKDKSNIEIDTTSWVEEVSDCLPLQHNGWDCGMFMLKYIDFHSRGLKPSFGQEDMMYFRKRTVKEIMRLRAD
ncbi:unnamed protein product [Urochloa decumbens]|uniref:Ubiquitin-like protease family profile domain-containing protein n=1 Tax=Urochloa decumbens TaxID=240449 RepID=A0ABC9FZ86_9POAL